VNGRARISRSLLRHEGGYAASFIIRTIVIFAILGLVAYEGGTILVASIQVHDAAGAGADAGADVYFGTKNVDRAKAAVIQAVKEENPDARVTAVDITKEGSVTVTAVETANTLVVSRMSFMKHLGVVHGTEESIRTG
jgi:Flp pilus assembly protein TadG